MSLRSGQLGLLLLGEQTRGGQAWSGYAQLGRLREAGEVQHGAGDGGDLTGEPLDSLRPHLVDVTDVVDEINDVLQVIINLAYRVYLQTETKHAENSSDNLYVWSSSVYGELSCQPRLLRNVF